MQHVIHLLHMFFFSSDLLHGTSYFFTWEIYSVAFIIIFLESACLFFVFLPGDSLLFILGVLAKQEVIHIVLITCIVIVSALLGNVCNYLLGKWIGVHVLRSRFRLISEEGLDRSHVFFNRYGSAAVVMARFLPLFRSLIPFLSGMVSMHRRSFFLASALGAVVWAVLVIGIGYILGDVSIIREHLTALMVIAVLFSFLSLCGLIYKQYQSRR